MLFGRAAGLAGLLVTLSPFAVYYNQERACTRSLPCSARRHILFARWLQSSPQRRGRIAIHPTGGRITAETQRRRGKTEDKYFSAPLRLCGQARAGMALVNAAGLYTQYSFPFTLLAQGLILSWRLPAKQQPPSPWLGGEAPRRLPRPQPPDAGPVHPLAAYCLGTGHRPRTGRLALGQQAHRAHLAHLREHGGRRGSPAFPVAGPAGRRAVAGRGCRGWRSRCR